MRIAQQLIAFGLKQVLGEGGDKVVDFLENYFTDHAGALPKALSRAHDRAWDALGIALAGDGFLDQIKVFFADADAKGLREQVRVFLRTNSFDFVGATADFRKRCLTELNAARKAGRMSTDHLTATEMRQPVADFRRYADNSDLLNGAHAAVADVARHLEGDYPTLALLLRQPTASGVPLLAAAFAYFFRREVQTNAELARGLHFDILQQLFAAQGASFAGIGGAVERLGDKVALLLDGVREQLDRVEAKVDTVLEELRRFAARHRVQTNEVSAKLVVSITNEAERILLKRLRDEYRKLPTEHQTVESLLLLADSLSAAGIFGAAQDLHASAACRAAVEKNGREAEAHFKTYRDACEQRHWDIALPALLRAAELDAGLYEPFPLHQYVPQRILGAGGFGAVILCHDRYAAEEDANVAVKTLHTDDLAREVKQVFAEAHVLSKLDEPTIIGVRSWSFADRQQTRPFIVMDFFDGVSLAEYLRHHGKLKPADLLAIAWPIAVAMKAAHGAKIFHRDLKPDNVLVRKSGARWEVRLIDFGLAVREQAVATSIVAPAGARSQRDVSYAGTFKYAPPEQKGETNDPIGPYSDVYTFGKTCFEALFQTTEPKSWDFEELPAAFQPLARLLERCTATPIHRRPPHFGPILEALEALDSAKVEQKQHAQEEVRKNREAEEKAYKASQHQKDVTRIGEVRRVDFDARKQHEAKEEGNKRHQPSKGLVLNPGGRTRQFLLPVVIMETSFGTIKIELNDQKAPLSTANFLAYVDEKFYDGTIFHRVIGNFMIQGGGFEAGLKEKRKTRAPIKNESPNGLSNVRGSIAMARTSDPDSATAQFYINVVDNAGSLDKPRYCVFGKVIDGLDVVDKIKAVKTGTKGGHQDVPATDVIITSLRRGCPKQMSPAIIKPECLAWNDRKIRKIAQLIHDESRFEDLPILADALEESGCVDAQILTHCRRPEEHVGACWVLDLVLKDPGEKRNE